MERSAQIHLSLVLKPPLGWWDNTNVPVFVLFKSHQSPLTLVKCRKLNWTGPLERKIRWNEPVWLQLKLASIEDSDSEYCSSLDCSAEQGSPLAKLMITSWWILFTPLGWWEDQWGEWGGSPAGNCTDMKHHSPLTMGCSVARINGRAGVDWVPVSV